MSKSSTVAEWLGTLDDDTRVAVDEVRALITSAHSELTEHIKWNAPSFCHGGDDRVTMNLGRKGEMRIVFHRGLKAREAPDFTFDDPDRLARWPSRDRAVVTLIDRADIEAKRVLLSRFIHRWVEATR